ncbi:hypothetical protein COT82_01285 [Candidatus Campbellbacteria bacterium CG10_big_fil_rev_8_21_14_0_10_35_52]|uniref:DUF4386 domain-containing protein n=1 Tax=Candidatus Campbellbacteria bacterium CG10_big_fil_rev_8_21_14_0_10_35_52 TaxID=1974527 RepID=A0A2M6WVF5_9BACT|nr:MAG: hypothetical protein COT82_01285 [Candidatus Campbellbacteria bacterium CG10_big_fil_rev_8_21_14_0_10_35_52]
MENIATKKQKIGNIQWIFMLGVAVMIDIIQIFLLFFFGVGLIVNRFITIFAAMTFFLWFALNGVTFLTGKMSNQKMFRFFGAAFGEFIPIIGSLPLWSFGIWFTIKSIRKEDEIG